MEMSGPPPEGGAPNPEHASAPSRSDLLKNILDSIPQAVFWKDRNGVFLGCNRAFAQAMGLNSPEDVIGKDDLQLPWPRSLAEAYRADDREVMDRCRAKRHIIEPVQTVEGVGRWVDTTKIPLTGENGEVIGILGVFEDITEKREAEDNTRRETERGRVLLDLYQRVPRLTDADLFAHALDAAVRLTNSAFGFFHVLSDNQTHIRQTTRSSTAPEACEANREDPRPIEEAGEGLDCVRLRSPVVRNDPSGPKNHEDVQGGNPAFGRFVSVPAMQGEKVRGVFVAAGKEDPYDDRDVFQVRLVANELIRILELRESERKFFAAFHSSPYLMAITRMSDGAILEVNEAYTRLLGFTREESLGRTTTALNIWAVPEDRMSFVSELRHSGRVNEFETRLRRKDGTEFPCVDSATILEFGGEACLLSVAHDITERKRAETVHKLLYQVARAAGTSCSLHELLEAVHSVVRSFMPARNLYIALLEDDGLIHFVYWADEKDPLPPPQPVREGLTARVLNTAEPLLATGELLEAFRGDGPSGFSGSHAAIWLGVPLLLESVAIGVLAVQHYEDPKAFDRIDLEILEFVASEVARAVDRKRAEAKILHLNRLYSLLSRTNEMLVRVEDREELFQEACRIAVEQGGFALAWVGGLDDATRSIVPVASFGDTAHCLDDLRFSADEVREGSGPAGLAYRLGRHAVCRDIETDPMMSLWRDRAAAAGFRSCASFPLKTGGETRAIFTVYSGESNWFSKEEVRLLDDLTADMSYALNYMDQEALRKSAEKDLQLLGTAIEQSDGVVVITDRDGTILYVNPAFEATSGYSPWEAVGRNPSILKSGLHDERFYKDIWTAISSGRVWSGQIVNKHKDGHLYTEQAVISPVRDPSNAIVAFVAVKRDISRELELQEQLERTKNLRTIGMIAGGVAHEVRNPLFSISVIVAALEKKLADHPELREHLTHIREQTDRLNRLMNDLLTLGRPLPQERFQPCSMQEVVQRSLRLVEDRTPGASERCDIHLDEGDLSTRGVQDRLCQVVVNLVQNALSFSPEGAKVDLDLRHDNDGLCLSVRDRGTGIDEKILPMLFQPFKTARKGGTGLGLAIVRQIMEAHGGTIEAANNAPPPGATFTIRLPLLAR